MIKQPLPIGLLAALTLSLAACGGGGGNDDDDGGGNPATYSIAGAITGLSAPGLVLQNGATTIPVASGATQVTVAGSVDAGATYAVTVQTQPAGLTCVVANGSGTVTGNVTNITVTCTAVSTATYSIGGTITGYAGTGLTLRLNGQTDTAFNSTPASGATTFTFAAKLTSGINYSVGVAAQPTGPVQNCTITNGGGTIGAADVSNVAVVCTAGGPFTVGGPVTGLTGTGLSLELGYVGAATPELLNVAAGATSYVFAAEVPLNGAFGVGIRSQPAGQACVISRGRGSSATPVTDVAVVCVDHVANPLRGTYTLLTDAGRQYLSFNADGTFTTAMIHDDEDCNPPGDTRNGNGIEYGVFDWNQATGGFSLPRPPVVDTNGECGVADVETFADSFQGTLHRSGSTLVITPDDEDPLVLAAVTSPDPATSLVGAYTGDGNNGVLLVLHADNTYVLAETQGRNAPLVGQERGCYTATATHITFSVNAGCQPDGLAPYDYNGALGAGNFGVVTSIGPVPYSIEDATTVTIGPFRYRRTAPN